MSHTHRKDSRSSGMPRMHAPKPVHSPQMNPPSARHRAARASDRIMDVVEVGAVGIVGAGLLGGIGDALKK